MVNGVTTLEAVKRTCDEFNKLGATAKKEGLQMMTHNEGFENSRLDDGRLTYPVLLEYLDPTDEDAIPDVVDAHGRGPGDVFHDTRAGSPLRTCRVWTRPPA
jgi:hypothetical protein